MRLSRTKCFMSNFVMSSQLYLGKMSGSLKHNMFSTHNQPILQGQVKTGSWHPATEMPLSPR